MEKRFFPKVWSTSFDAGVLASHPNWVLNDAASIKELFLSDFTEVLKDGFGGISAHGEHARRLPKILDKFQEDVLRNMLVLPFTHASCILCAWTSAFRSNSSSEFFR
eukprot:Skav234145  [mRNA]  locus=scaffold361:151043:155608:+ [translate_table: standard]